MEQRPEWFNVAEVDILMDLLIRDLLSRGWPHNRNEEEGEGVAEVLPQDGAKILRLKYLALLEGRSEAQVASATLPHVQKTNIHPSSHLLSTQWGAMRAAGAV